jgi:nucleotide-binding universal stress UspA family protein
MKSALVDSTFGSTELPRELTAEKIQADFLRLQRLTEPLGTSGFNVSLKQFHNTTVANIVEEPLKLGGDLIIVRSRHHSSLYSLLVGSVTDLVLKCAKCPVLVVSIG